MRTRGRHSNAMRWTRRKRSTATYPKNPYDGFEPGFSVGGPIKHDIAWFYLAYEPLLTHTERTVTFALDGSSGTFAQRTPSAISSQQARRCNSGRGCEREPRSTRRPHAQMACCPPWPARTRRSATSTWSLTSRAGWRREPSISWPARGSWYPAARATCCLTSTPITSGRSPATSSHSPIWACWTFQRRCSA